MCPILHDGSDVPGDEVLANGGAQFYAREITADETLTPVRTPRRGRLGCLSGTDDRGHRVATRDRSSAQPDQRVRHRSAWLARRTRLPGFSRCLRLPRGRPARQAAGQSRPDRAVHAVLLRVGYCGGRPVRCGPSDDADECADCDGTRPRRRRYLRVRRLASGSRCDQHEPVAHCRLGWEPQAADRDRALAHHRVRDPGRPGGHSDAG